MSWEKYCEYYRHKLYYSYDLFHLNQYLFLLVIAFTNSLPLIFPNTAYTLGQLTITVEKSTVNGPYLSLGDRDY